jgi:hypothetical protein
MCDSVPMIQLLSRTRGRKEFFNDFLKFCVRQWVVYKNEWAAPTAPTYRCFCVATLDKRSSNSGRHSRGAIRRHFNVIKRLLILEQKMRWRVSRSKRSAILTSQLRERLN